VTYGDNNCPDNNLTAIKFSIEKRLMPRSLSSARLTTRILVRLRTDCLFMSRWLMVNGSVSLAPCQLRYQRQPSARRQFACAQSPLSGPQG
jgi:hypothetical protein